MRDPRRFTASITNFFVMLAESILAVRFVFRLFDADLTNSFVHWIYSMSEPLLEPVRNLIGAQSFDQRFILDYRTALAMVFWAFVGYLVLVIVDVVPRPKVDRNAGWRKWLRNVV